MAPTVDIRSEGARATPTLEACIRYWAGQLTAHGFGIERCTVHITSERPLPPHRRSYRVSLQLDLPDVRVHSLVEPHLAAAQDGVFAAVREAFRRARAILEQHTSDRDITRPIAA